jgi:hypothetical protein
MAEKAKSVPHTAEERQAIATVQATRAVYGEIEKLAAVIKDNQRPVAERADAKHGLGQASERLCNLMALALYQMDANTRSDLRERLALQLDEIKGKLVRLSARLMVEKLEKIDQRATEVLEDRDYPIGLAGKLDIAFANLMSNLRVLGGPEKLGDKVPDLVAKTETDLRNLSEIEQKLGVLNEVKPSRKPRS